MTNDHMYRLFQEERACVFIDLREVSDIYLTVKFTHIVYSKLILAKS